MTDATQALGSSDKSSSPTRGRFGSFGRGVTPEQAKEIEALGYGAVWVGGSPPAELDWVEPILEKNPTPHLAPRTPNNPPAELDWVEPILEKTTTLQLATGIVNIWTAAAGPVAESFYRIDKAYPGRF